MWLNLVMNLLFVNHPIFIFEYEGPIHELNIVGKLIGEGNRVSSFSKVTLVSKFQSKKGLSS